MTTMCICEPSRPNESHIQDWNTFVTQPQYTTTLKEGHDDASDQ